MQINVMNWGVACYGMSNRLTRQALIFAIIIFMIIDKIANARVICSTFKNILLLAATRKLDPRQKHLLYPLNVLNIYLLFSEVYNYGRFVSSLITEYLRAVTAKSWSEKLKLNSEKHLGFTFPNLLIEELIIFCLKFSRTNFEVTAASFFTKLFINAR